jgi:DNA-binding response OmpR family regulator
MVLLQDRAESHTVHTAESGELGLEKLRVFQPDIVVLDLMLPGIDGFETCRRIRAVLRRAVSERPAGGEEPAAERHGGLVIDRAGLVVTKNGEPVSLTPTELKLLLELSRTPGQVYSRQQILSAVWDHDYLGDSRLVDACVQRLRAKIEDVPAKPDHVQTVRGFGYRFGRS